jgi:hypothetical protein
VNSVQNEMKFAILETAPTAVPTGTPSSAPTISPAPTAQPTTSPAPTTPTALPTWVPVPQPSALPTTPVPTTPAPSTLPTLRPSTIPWDIKNYAYIQLACFLASLLPSAFILIRERRRADAESTRTRGKKLAFLWSNFFTPALSIYGLVNEILYIHAYQDLGDGVGREGELVLSLAVMICLPRLLILLWRDKLALDAGELIKGSWLYGPLLIVAVFNGHMVN